MDKLTFVAGLDELCAVFDRKASKEKADLFFEQLKHFDNDTFERAVIKIVRGESRFPSLNIIISACSSIKMQETQNYAGPWPCNQCNGWGWTEEAGQTLRARCEHGARISDKIPMAKQSNPRPEPKPLSEVDPDEFAAKVIKAASKNPIQFFKGFRQTEGYLKAANPAAWKKAGQALADLIGRDRAKKLWNEKPNLRVVPK